MDIDLLLDPSDKDKVVVVWLGGHALHINSTKVFNDLFTGLLKF